MPAVRIPAIALAALALLPASASAATVTVTGDDGNPLPINTSAPTAIRNVDVQYAVTFGNGDPAYRFKGSSLVLGGRVAEAIRIRRSIRFG